ncbi:sigma-54 interaction domain-containing protein [Bordetella genomosp. 13]|uniref:Sigma-54-dependent Fis family transcriptional regulator n=1 Tax=Bordetella genomosp. 13 TaxID=463040 RepID=A0A1W6Z6Z8_9BORD|nr:sigma 54-interacting transcriptional regulator [Bordetella genomosp. 13]ARP92995.1 sigma-54-dependent Fis family transcriptional regulator [Bordetella genomosp. 13]
MENDVRGVAVLDTNGDVRFTSGIGADPVLLKDLSRRWCARAVRPVPPLFALEHLDEPLSVFSTTLQDSVCFLVYQHEAGDPLFEFVGSVDFAGDILRHFITNPYGAITVVDTEGTLRYLSPVHEKFFNLSRGGGVGRPAREVIENSRLDSVLRSGKAEIGQTQEMHGTTRVVSRTPIFNRQRRVVGAIGQVMFKSPDAMQKMSEEISRLRKEVDFYKRELSGLERQSRGLESIVGASEPVTRLKEQIIKIAPLDVPVLLLGESGVGKDMVAHAIHMLSPRARDPMVVINAAALPVSLVESELFGYEGGAFTGAERKGRRGKFEQADRGTLFLDEIGDMPLEIQVKLLRTLQDGSFQRVGGDALRRSDFRLISASNRNFNSMIEKGSFRLDLFYRISAVTLRVPSLRDRLEDIPDLAATFLKQFADRHGKAVKEIEPAAVRFLQSLPWPGNVRQLQHAVERAAIFCEGEAIRVADFEMAGDIQSSYHLDSASVAGRPALPARAAQSDLPMKAVKDRMEAELIADVMQRYQGNKKKAAEVLGISRSYLYKRLAEMERGGESD